MELNVDLLKKIFVENDRKANKKDTSKQDRRTYIAINQKILDLIG